jgi:hypothetical protein
MAFTTFSTFTAPPIELGATHPYFDMLAKIGNAYTDSAKVDADQLWASSARIIHEHTTRAWLSASQACMEALAQNAAAIQQQSFARMGAANQKAVEIMTSAFTDAMMAGFRPASR